MRGLRFLFANGDAGGARSMLLIQSGSQDVVTRAVDAVHRAYGDARLTVLLQRHMKDKVPLRDGVEYLHNTAGKMEMITQLRQRRFDAAFILYSNHSGFWKLKLLPFVIGAGRVFAVNENIDWFPINLCDARRLAGHIRWRLNNAVWEGPSGIVDGARVLTRVLGYPIVLIRLLAYERAASLRALLKGGARWKNDTRFLR